MKEIKELLLGDIHCRDFWKEPVKNVLENHPNAHITFLGDYVDGYPFEWEGTNIDYKQQGVDNLNEIVGLKKQHPDRITLLLGNHDCGYAISHDICDCRTDRARHREIELLFTNNKEYFQLIHHIDAGQKILLTHAGLKRDFLKQNNIDPDKFDVEAYFNNAWATDDYKVLMKLGDVDKYRGGFWYTGRAGSFIWSDIEDWFDGKTPKDEGFGFQIFGHTYLKEAPIITDKFACIDCRKAFVIGEDNVLDTYENFIKDDNKEEDKEK